MLTMLLIDDEYLIKRGIRETIEWEKYGITIVDEADNGSDGLEKAIKYTPDIILTDIRMPLMDGLELMSKLRENGLDSSVIVISGYEDFNYVRNALKHGAVEYLLKPVDNQQLIDAVLKTAKKIKEERSARHYFERLKNELSSIKKQFLRELILGEIKNRDEIIEKLEFLEIPVETSCNYVISIKINDYNLVLEQLTKEVMGEFKECIISLTAQLLLLNSRFMGVVLDKDDEEWVIILHKTDPCDDIIEFIKERCVELTKRLNKDYRQTISIGISDICDDIEKLHETYREAFSASFFKLLPGNSSVGFIKDRDATGCRREVRESIAFIKNNYSKDITIELAANELYISSSYLMHLFKDELGKTFNECLTDCRIQVAKDLLRDPKYKVYEVSEIVGYGDVKYFSQVFRKNTGMSPSEYIKNKT